MKRLLCFIALLVCAISCQASDVHFAWDYTVGANAPTGFELRLSTVSAGTAVITQDCPSATIYTCTVPAVPKGSYFARVYAYAVDSVSKNYSNPSNEISFTIIGTPNDRSDFKI